MGLQRWIERSVTTVLLLSTVACLLVVLYSYHETSSTWDDDVTVAVYSLDDEKYAKNGVDDMKDASINKDAVKEEWEEKMEALFQSYKSSQAAEMNPLVESVEVQQMNNLIPNSLKQSPSSNNKTGVHDGEVNKTYIASTMLPLFRVLKGSKSKPLKSSKSINVCPEYLTKQKRENNYLSIRPGVLNVHIWEGWCGSRVEDLKRNKHFPLYPSIKSNLTRFFTQWYETGFGERIFGYIHPPETGNYTFAVSCDDNCEVWLSNSSDPHYAHKIVYVGTMEDPANTNVADFKEFDTQISQQIFLQNGSKYYIEALHKQAAFKDHLLLTWLAPSWPRIKSISSKYISSYIDTELNNIDVNDFVDYIPESEATSSQSFHGDPNLIYTLNRTKHKFGTVDERDQIKQIRYINETELENILPYVEYSPSYRIDFVPKRYEGIKLVHETAIYPNDYTELTHMFLYEDCLSPRSLNSHLNPISQSDPTVPVHASTTSTAFNLEEQIKEKYQFLFKNFKSKSQNNSEINLRNSQVRNLEKNKLIADAFNLRKKKNLMSRMENQTIQQKNQFNNTNVIVKYTKNDSLSFKNQKLLELSFRTRKLLRYDNGSDFSNSRFDLKVSFKPNSFLNDSVAVSETISGNTILKTTLSPARYHTSPITILPYKRRTYKIHDSLSSAPNQQYSRGYVFGTSVASGTQVHARTSPFYRYRPAQKSSIFSYMNQQIPLKITKKIFFKDGKSTNVSITNNYQLIRLYDIFGPSIYYLTQSRPRGLLWKYKSVKSTCKTDGNLLLASEVAVSVVNKFMAALRKKHGRKYYLKEIINVEENHDLLKGDRYLIEIDVSMDDSEELHRISRYVYRDIISDQIYEPKDFQWNPLAVVHVIVPVKDQGRWVQHFIDNMENISMSSSHVNINVIIVDFSSSDIDIEMSLKNSKLKSYNLVKLDGAFQRALGLQAGLDLVKSPDDIVFTCDLHLEIPARLIDAIRKHTIKGKMAFAPMVHRLSCGYTPELPYGLWEIEGYGLFSITKYDFDRIGGMNTKEFKTKWGGEDWELVDRTLAHGLEVERLRIPNFYHYYHSKKRMWVSPNIPSIHLSEKFKKY